jgi:hypothetical protein
MWFFISIILSLYSINTAFNLFGPGTCSFDGASRLIYIQRYYDGSGAVECDAAGLIIIFFIGSYWIYVYLKYQNNKKQIVNKLPIRGKGEYEVTSSTESEYSHNIEIEKLEKKLTEISEEEKLESLRLELNLKRQDRGLVSLEELEGAEFNLNKLNLKLIEATQLVDEYSNDIEAFTRYKSKLKYYTIGGLALSSAFMSSLGVSFLYNLFLISSLVTFSGYYFARYSKKIDLFSKEINHLESEKDRIKIELAKLSTFIQKNQL